ncbi:PP2C family protein-serine/threonine phosphatase [Ruegeria lacuscaerulensis]|uniref:PP2C family protein-serine/threonine phosphatase n=1 Tax=Ruegeria lacuscaerulensis TaxID=55218 RepID=UPI001479FBCD|nr:protein phosphatase 2C domain-containing protein [Ruegeria lacuscaerulensis]
MLATPAYDIALILDQGRRDTQEDAVAARMFDVANAGYIVVADGMGGHAAGDIASELVIKAWRGALDPELETGAPSKPALIDALPLAAMQANALIAQHSEEQGDGFNMGSTLLGTLLMGSDVYWISIGDSPLYLFRDGALRQINEDHSMAPIIDAQCAEGKLTQDEAHTHPDRNQLTSVIMGAAIPKVDCPEHPVALTASDVLIAGSDGLQYLSDAEIEAIVQAQSGDLAQDIADALWQALRDKGDPDQDNASIAVVKLTRNE